MIKIINTSNKINIENVNGDENIVTFNGEQLNDSEVKIKDIFSNGHNIKRIEGKNFNFNIIGEDVYGKINNIFRFKGKLGIDLNLEKPNIQADLSNGSIKMCGCN